MKKTWHKTMVTLIKNFFIVLLNNTVNGSNLTKYISLSNQ